MNESKNKLRIINIFWELKLLFNNLIYCSFYQLKF